MPWTIEDHNHRFAVWAAARGAFLRSNFERQDAAVILEACGFSAAFAEPSLLPPPDDVDRMHRIWRLAAIEKASAKAKALTHGRAAKLINLYLKSRFVCAGHQEHERVRTLHPPIDRELLGQLTRKNVGGLGREWRRARDWAWSNFSAEQYESVIETVRCAVKGKPMWTIEEHWLMLE